MPDNSKKKVTAIFAALLVVVAVGAAVLLFSDNGGNGEEPQIEQLPLQTQGFAAEQTTGLPFANQSAPGGALAVVQGKYLWEYGWQQYASELPSEMPTVESDEPSETETTAGYEPQTYYKYVTNWRGEKVTDSSGKPVTEVYTQPQTKVHILELTDENGEVITDEYGNAVTEVYSELVTAGSAPVQVTDENGEAVTNDNGEAVTATEPAEEERTTAVVGGVNTTGASQWAQGVSDGEKYVRMKIYMDGEYDTRKNNSVMTMSLSQNGNVLNIPDTLVYNLSKGTCTIGAKKYSNMAFVTKSGGQTIVTLIIPENARPNVADTTEFKASSTVSTFLDSSEEFIDEFTVSVDLTA